MNQKEKFAEQITEKIIKEVSAPEELHHQISEMVKPMVLHDAYNNPK